MQDGVGRCDSCVHLRQRASRCRMASSPTRSDAALVRLHCQVLARGLRAHVRARNRLPRQTRWRPRRTRCCTSDQPCAPTFPAAGARKRGRGTQRYEDFVVGKARRGQELRVRLREGFPFERGERHASIVPHPGRHFHERFVRCGGWVSRDDRQFAPGRPVHVAGRPPPTIAGGGLPFTALSVSCLNALGTQNTRRGCVARAPVT
jgi:hypothetical protein